MVNSHSGNLSGAVTLVSLSWRDWNIPETWVILIMIFSVLLKLAVLASRKDIVYARDIPQ